MSSSRVEIPPDAVHVSETIPAAQITRDLCELRAAVDASVKIQGEILEELKTSRKHGDDLTDVVRKLLDRLELDAKRAEAG